MISAFVHVLKLQAVALDSPMPAFHSTTELATFLNHRDAVAGIVSWLD
ncbi:MAG: hypothetical protein M0P50_00785 [Bacteroidales bacterium]|nr:hypothetical protein [Bacteroidales bacterium]